MSYDKENCERLMVVCQRGYPCPPIGAEYANNTLSECYGAIGSAVSEISRLAAELECARGDLKTAMEIAEKNRADAERYRWLRSPAVGPHIISTHLFETVSDDVNPPYRTMKIDKELDEAIDRRMQEQK